MNLQHSVSSHVFVSPRTPRVDFAYLDFLWRSATPISALVLSDEIGARLARVAGIEIVVSAFSDGGPPQFPSEKTATLIDAIKATEAIRGVNAYSFLVGDIPLSCYASETTQLEAAWALTEAGADAIKIEGGKEIAPLVREMTSAGIPVVGHIGYTPKTGMRMRLRGTTLEDRQLLHADAVALRNAGAKALVLELVRADAAAFLTRNLPLPTISVYSGGGTSGQALVLNDILDITRFDSAAFPKGKPKAIGHWSGSPIERVEEFLRQVKEGEFPA